MVVDVTSESLGPRTEILNQKDGPSSFPGKDGGDGTISMMDIWKKMQVMERRNKEQEEKIEVMLSVINEAKERVMQQGEK